MNRIILVVKHDYRYSVEYINSFKGSDQVIVYDETTPKFTEPAYYLCVRRVPFKLIPEGSKIGFVNTEQLTVPSKMEEYKTFALDNVEVFDFSLHNIELSGKGTHLPYLENVEETAFLKKCLEVPKKFNIGCIGSPSQYRSEKLKALIGLGLSVDFISDTFGEERDKRIGQCSVLLNLHYGPEFMIYEAVRCERLRFAGMKIVSLPCCDIPADIIVSDDLVSTFKGLFPDARSVTLGLCMIVKDESHIIHEALEATLPLIDTFSIVDTGSSDNTIQIVRDFYAKHGIEGTVHERPWKGFGESRTEALATCTGKMDYILMMDADDLMTFPPNTKEFLKRALNETKPNAGNVQIRRGANNSLEYHRTQIFKADDGWRYVGVLHEYPTNDKPNNRILKLPDDIIMIGRTMGNRSKMVDGPEKYRRDAATLLKALETEPENDRYVFYLAQSYRDACMNDEAVKWYKKRFEMGKWQEEMFVSAYNISKLLHDKEWAWKAHETCPHRSESLVNYITGCRMKGMWSQELFAMASYAASIPKPAQDCLFVEADIYRWRALDELGNVAAYTGHKEASKAAFIKLLHENQYPPSEKTRLENNLKACLN